MNNHALSSIIIFILLLITSIAFSQQPGFNSQRAQEDYSHLKDSTNLKWGDAIKYISLNKNRTSYLGIGGSIRTTFDNYQNQFWVAPRDLNYYSQRIAIHTAWQFGNNFKLFGELQSGYVTGDPIILYSDDLDIHQAFAEYKLNSTNLTVRLGRQEFSYGSGRLYDLRQGPNIRQTFDLAKVRWEKKDYNIDVFYGGPVAVNYGVFDNKSDFFNRDSLTQIVWGAYGQFKILPKKDEGINTEIYYLGINSQQATYNDVTGEETRHTIGLRRFGKVGKRFTHNHELIYQFGKLGESTISAFNIEALWQFQMIHTKWMPTIGLKLDWSSGDSVAGDGSINSFNPMFVNPSLYGLAGINTPINIFSLHPNITLYPSKKMMIQLEYAIFSRSSSNDAAYLPPNIYYQPANSAIPDKSIGNTIGFIFFYQMNKNFNFLLRSTYFRSGDFIIKSGLSDEVFQISPQLSYTF